MDRHDRGNAGTGETTLNAKNCQNELVNEDQQDTRSHIKK